MDDATTMVTEQNWFQRMGSSFGSLCLGLLLVPITICVIFWNETNCVKTYATADLVGAALVVDDCAAIPSNNGKLVYVNGCKLTTDHLGHELPDVLQQFVPDGFMATEVTWTVEMMQWKEECEEQSHTTKTNTGGTKTVTTRTCTDKMDWVTSAGEPKTKDHANFGQFPSNIAQNGQRSAQVTDTYLSSTVGDSTNSFVLNEDLISYFPSFDPALKTGTGLSGSSWAGQNYSGELKANQLRVTGNVLQTGSSIGDIKITITAQGCEVSQGCLANVAAVQTQGASGITFKPYAPKSYNLFGQKTYPLERLDTGSSETKQEFIDEYKTEAQMKVWLIRLVCIVVMCAAWQCIFAPLSVMTDLVMFLNFCTCCLGSLLDKASQTVIGCVSCSASLVCFSVFFVLAWCVARPVYAVFGLVLIAVVVGLSFALFSSRKKADARSVCTPYVKLHHHGEIVLPAVV
jgi:hypothetical protein